MTPFRPVVQVYTIGRGDCGRLGTGEEGDHHAPVEVKALAGKRVCPRALPLVCLWLAARASTDAVAARRAGPPFRL